MKVPCIRHYIVWRKKDSSRAPGVETETGRRARFYTLKKKGTKALKKEAARWEEHAGAVFAVLRYSED